MNVIELDGYDLAKAERALCDAALREAGSIQRAALLLGITRHALKRRIEKYEIDWPRSQSCRPILRIADA